MAGLCAGRACLCPAQGKEAPASGCTMRLTLRTEMEWNWPSSVTTSPKAKKPSADRKSTRLNSSHLVISYAVFCLKKKKNKHDPVEFHLQQVRTVYGTITV